MAFNPEDEICMGCFQTMGLHVGEKKACPRVAPGETLAALKRFCEPSPMAAAASEIAAFGAENIDRLQRKLARYEQALNNIATIIDGKADASVEDGEPTCNDYASIQAQIDEARR